MIDYWNDPPEMPEPPECCEELMDILEDGTCVCHCCGHKVEPPQDIEPEPFAGAPDEPAEEQDHPKVCRHGNDSADCGSCDHESDIAYDSWRESR